MGRAWWKLGNYNTGDLTGIQQFIRPSKCAFNPTARLAVGWPFELLKGVLVTCLILHPVQAWMSWSLQTGWFIRISSISRKMKKLISERGGRSTTLWLSMPASLPV